MQACTQLWFRSPTLDKVGQGKSGDFTQRMGIPDVITKLRGAESLSLQPSFMQWKNVLMPIDYLLKDISIFLRKFILGKY